jgi:hypothetical protein
MAVAWAQLFFNVAAALLLLPIFQRRLVAFDASNASGWSRQANAESGGNSRRGNGRTHSRPTGKKRTMKLRESGQDRPPPSFQKFNDFPYIFRLDSNFFQSRAKVA